LRLLLSVKGRTGGRLNVTSLGLQTFLATRSSMGITGLKTITSHFASGVRANYYTDYGLSTEEHSFGVSSLSRCQNPTTPTSAAPSRRRPDVLKWFLGRLQANRCLLPHKDWLWVATTAAHLSIQGLPGAGKLLWYGSGL